MPRKPKLVRDGRPGAPKPHEATPDLPERLGRGVLTLLVLAVPLAVSLHSENPVDVKDVILGLGAVLGLSLWLVAGLRQGRLAWVRSPLTPITLAYLLWAALSVVHSRYRSAAITEAGHLAANVGFYCLALASLRTFGQVRRLLLAACLAAIPVSLYAFAQAAGLDFVSWAKDSDRAFSSLGNPTYLGGFVALLIPLAAAVAWPPGDRSPRARACAAALPLLSLALMVVAGYISFALAAAIGLGLGALLAAALAAAGGGRAARRRTAIGLAAAVLLTGLLAPPLYRHLPPAQRARVSKVVHLQDPFAADRQLHWRTALRIFHEQPVWGQGYGTFRVSALEGMSPTWYGLQPARAGMLVPTYAHNEYLQVLADGGLVAGALFLALLLVLSATILRVALRHPDGRWRRLGLGVAAATTALLFQNGYGVTFRETGVVMFFWLWAAVTAVASAWLPAGREALSPLPRELRFRRASPQLTTLAGLGAAALFGALSWVSIRSAIAGVTVREAQDLASRGRYREAIAASRSALSRCPDSWLAYATIAYAAGQLSDPRQAAQAGERALALSPGNASVYYNLGVAYKQLNQLDRAAGSFRRAIALLPFKEHHLGLAETLLAQGELAEAEQEARRALAMDPGSAPIHLLLADIAARRARGRIPPAPTHAAVTPGAASSPQETVTRLLAEGRPREALAPARAWARQQPASAAARSALGACLLTLHDFAGARQALSHAVRLNPRDLRARLLLANAAGALGDTTVAVRELRRVVAEGPGTAEARDAESLLKQLSSP